MSTALISVEGVLGEEDVVHGFYPLIEGMKLVRALRSQYQIILASTRPDERIVETFLMVAGFGKPQDYEELIWRERQWTDLTDSALRVEQARTIRSRGYDIGMFLSADPAAVLETTAVGVPGLFYAHPAYNWPEFRPDHHQLPREWQEIEDEVTRQRELRTTDPRLAEMRED